MKTINVKPIEEIEIQFADGKSFICSFNMLAMAYMQEELTKLDMNYNDIPNNVMVPLLLYAGIKSNHDEFTMAEARELVKSLSLEYYKTIIGAYRNSLVASKDDEKKTRNQSRARK